MGIFSTTFDKGTPEPEGESRAAARIDAKAVLEAAARKERQPDFAAVITLLTPLVNDRGLPAEERAAACIMRGNARAESRDLEGGIADFTLVIESTAAPDQRAQALLLRAQAKSAVKGGDRRAGLEDYTAALRLPGISTENRAKVLHLRALALQYVGNFKGAAADHTSIIELPDIPVQRRAKSLLARAEVRVELRDVAGELQDYETALALPGLPDEERGRALFHRGYHRQWVTRDTKAAAVDYKAALNVGGLSQEIREEARKALESLGQDHAESTGLADKIRAIVDAQRRGQIGSVSFEVEVGAASEREQARALCTLLQGGLAASAEAREIGEKLHAEGGEDLMVRVCDLVGEMRGQARLLETMWGGIGDWQG